MGDRKRNKDQPREEWWGGQSRLIRSHLYSQANTPKKSLRQSPEQRGNLASISLGVWGLLGNFISHDLVQHGGQDREHRRAPVSTLRVTAKAASYLCHRESCREVGSLQAVGSGLLKGISLLRAGFVRIPERCFRGKWGNLYQTKQIWTLNHKGRRGKKSHKPSIFDHLISIQMISSGICGSDDHMLKGELLANFPLIPGHEGAGIVESVGDGVCSVKPGRKWEMGFSSEQLAWGTPDRWRRHSACTVGAFSRVCL